jgi:hypothetical protein
VCSYSIRGDRHLLFSILATSSYEFELVFMYDEATGKPEATEIHFTWDGGTTATFRYDAWESPDDPSFVFEINSSPVYGWASWINGDDVLIAFSCPDAEEEGWAHAHQHGQHRRDHAEHRQPR